MDTNYYDFCDSHMTSSHHKFTSAARSSSKQSGDVKKGSFKRSSSSFILRLTKSCVFTKLPIKNNRSVKMCDLCESLQHHPPNGDFFAL